MRPAALLRSRFLLGLVKSRESDSCFIETMTTMGTTRIVQIWKLSQTRALGCCALLTRIIRRHGKPVVRADTRLSKAWKPCRWTGKALLVRFSKTGVRTQAERFNSGSGIVGQRESNFDSERARRTRC